MNRWIFLGILVSCACLQTPSLRALEPTNTLSTLTKNQVLADFRVANLYSDPDGRIVAVKFWHVPTGAPVFILQIETVPQAFTWVDTPDNSNRGLPHSLEHLLESKGTKGRYFKLLKDMRLSRSDARTYQDFNYYGYASGSGLEGFFELLHAWLDALYSPDFTDAEAEREFYHFGLATDPTTKKETLVEQGSVYDEMQTGQGSYTYYLELNKRVLGEQNPFGFSSAGFPDEMRGTTVEEIRSFHFKHYRLGPTTGFIFALDPKESVPAFLQRVSRELHRFSAGGPLRPEPPADQPKYPISPATTNETKIYLFPGASETDPGEVRFSWKPIRTESPVALKLGQLFFRALAQGERSLLYKSLVDSKTRAMDSGATTVESEPFLGNSPYFPVWNVGVSGIPGNRVSAEEIGQIKFLLLAKIKEISEYPDGSENLLRFNELVTSYAKAWHRFERVWIRNAPDFGDRGAQPSWKEYFESLEIDPSFNRSISEEPVWQTVDEELRSGKNIWRELIERFGLLNSPYAAGSAPSRRLLDELEKQKQDRVRKKIETLMAQHHTRDDQDALARFEQGEIVKAKEIAQIEKGVHRPRFTDHPPMTWDDDISYKQFLLAGSVPVIATIFNRPPTTDIGLSFDLSKIPKKYYKYLPLLPRCFDSLGIKRGEHVISYSELLAEIRTTIYAFSAAYEFDALSKRADLTLRVSGANMEEFRSGLNMVRRIMQSNYLDLANADRLRDIVKQRLSFDDSFTKQDEEDWISNPAYSFLHQDDRLFFALNSQFTWAHWDWRLKWLLHDPVSLQDVDALGNFATEVLSSSSRDSKRGIIQALNSLEAKGLEKELVEYWQRNLSLFPESERIEGLRQLADEVQQDLRTGPARAIADMKELQKIILNRRALHVDLTLSQAVLDEIRPDLTDLLASVPSHPFPEDAKPHDASSLGSPIMAKLDKRYGLSVEQFPRHVGFVNPDSTTGNVIFYASFPGYSRLDHRSLVEVLSSNLFSGLGPQSFHMKASEAGLAYSSSLTSDPSGEYVWYYADRSPDIPSLVGLVNSSAATIPELRDPSLVDYALRQTFSVPRSMYTFSQRGWALAQDIRNGNPPEKIRRFSEAILKLRRDPDLLSELKQAGFGSICGVLLTDKCREQQRTKRSIFFFVGPESILSDAERRLSIPKLFRVYPSDYWMQ